MRVHLLGLPHAPTSRAYGLCGFTQRTILFAELLKRLGHTVVLYGTDGNEAPCDEFVCVQTEAQRLERIGSTPYQSVPFDPASPLYVGFNNTAAAKIGERRQPGDVIATIAGQSQLAVWNQHADLKSLEYSIGYQGVFAQYRVYQSHVWRHLVHGNTGLLNGRWQDAVIPPWFEVAEFPYVDRPEPYLVYCGRVVDLKGVRIASRAAALAGLPLKILGFGDLTLAAHDEYCGSPTGMERNALLAHATAVLMPTQYLEPFGNVAAEAQLCGTPVIASDFGAFVESVEPGVSGYRCATLGEYADAIRVVRSLDRALIRRRAIRLYSTDAAATAYAAYFARMVNPHGADAVSVPVIQESYVPAELHA